MIRVGADTGSLGGGFLSPVFEDRDFEFICIPETKDLATDYKYSKLYGNIYQNDNNPLSSKLKDLECKKMRSVHLDPDFNHFTYGNPGGNMSALGKLEKDDYLVFYAGMQKYLDKTSLKENPHDIALYIVGYFQLEEDVTVIKDKFDMGNHLKDKNFIQKFKGNPHLFEVVYNNQFDRKPPKPLYLIKGSKYSRSFNKAIRFAEKVGSGYKIQCENLLALFGYEKDLCRSIPRQIHHDDEDKRIEVIKFLIDKANIT